MGSAVGYPPSQVEEAWIKDKNGLGGRRTLRMVGVWEYYTQGFQFAL